MCVHARMCACVCVCLHARMCACVCCTAVGEHTSTLLESVQTGYGAATRVGFGAWMEGEEPTGMTRDKVSMHWSEGWCRHGTWISSSGI